VEAVIEIGGLRESGRLWNPGNERMAAYCTIDMRVGRFFVSGVGAPGGFSKMFLVEGPNWWNLVFPTRN